MITGINELKSDIRKIKTIDTSGLNQRRAKVFKSNLEKWLKEGSLGLKSISPATMRQRISNLGGPLYDTGEFAKSSNIHQIGKNTEAGYFEGETTIRGKIDSARLADIHNEGKGNNPWRPFMDNSQMKYEEELDEEVIDQYLDEVLGV